MTVQVRPRSPRSMSQSDLLKELETSYTDVYAKYRGHERSSRGLLWNVVRQPPPADATDPRTSQLRAAQFMYWRRRILMPMGSVQRLVTREAGVVTGQDVTRYRNAKVAIQHGNSSDPHVAALHQGVEFIDSLHRTAEELAVKGTVALHFSGMRLEPEKRNELGTRSIDYMCSNGTASEDTLLQWIEANTRAYDPTTEMLVRWSVNEGSLLGQARQCNPELDKAIGPRTDSCDETRAIYRRHIARPGFDCAYLQPPSIVLGENVLELNKQMSAA